MKRILITGAAGFIGSHLAENLLKNNYYVMGIDNLSGAYDRKYYPNNLKILKKYKSFTFHKIDLFDQKKIIFIFKENNFDFVIHCAAKTNVRESTKNPQEYIRNNVLGTQILLEAIKQSNSKTKTIIFSSSSVYGKQNKVPFKEDMIPNPISPYGLSKYLMEQIVKYYSEYYGLKTVVLRPFSIYGPRGRQDMLPSILLRCAKNNLPFTQYGNDKNNQRDWTYVDDLSNLIIKIVNDYDFKSYSAFNVGRSRPIGIEYFIKIFRKKIEKKISINKRPCPSTEIPIVYANSSKAKKVFNYEFKIQLELGLQKILVKKTRIKI